MVHGGDRNGSLCSDVFYSEHLLPESFSGVDVEALSVAICRYLEYPGQSVIEFDPEDDVEGSIGCPRIDSTADRRS